MTSPRHYLTRMLLFLIAVAVAVGVLAPQLYDAFFANPALNGLIVGVMFLGIGYIFRQVFMLNREVKWIESIRTGRPGISVQARPILLAPMAAMLGERTQRFSLTAPAMRSLLDGVASRLDEQRDISRYLIGLLIFLGLLGTFWGLLQTISSVAAVIGELSVGGGGDVGAVFNDLKRGLKEPLTGMGTAFSTSLFGLAGSLALGFLELQAGQAQNRFYNDLEDWLSGQTRIGGAATAVDGDASVPAFVQALLEQTADSLEALQRTLDRSEESRIGANDHINNLTEKLTALTEQMRAEQSLMIKLAESQLELKPILAKLSEQQSGSFGDDGTRNHVRNIDVSLARLHEELATGRSETVQELRSEIRVLARTIAAVADKATR
jgi:hypothetical protein